MTSHADQQRNFYDHKFKKLSTPDMDQSIRTFYVKKLVDILKRQTDPARIVEVLEVGVGEGLLMQEMQKHFPRWRVQGIDISQKNIEIARAKGLNVKIGDANRLDLAQKFDLIYATAVLHHLEDVSAFFVSAARHLNPRGVLLIGAEPTYDAFIHFLYYKWRGVWDIEKGMLNIRPQVFKGELARDFSQVDFYRYGSPFVFWHPWLGRVWTGIGLTCLPWFNDLYIFARKTA